MGSTERNEIKLGFISSSNSIMDDPVTFDIASEFKQMMRPKSCH